MVQQHHTLWSISKQHQFCPESEFAGKQVLNFSPATAQKVMWPHAVMGVRSWFDIATSLFGLTWRT
jgi:hypothetical protein